MGEQIATALGTGLSAIAAVAGVVMAWKVHKEQNARAQRQLILPLWQYLDSLDDIDPTSPVVPDVIKAVNTLELVALLCEGGMVDEQVILRTFRSQFIDLYKKIESCPNLSGVNKTGKQLLEENAAATAFYEKLRQENLARDRLDR